MPNFSGGGGKGVRDGAALPATCAVGDVFYKTTATVGFYECTSTDTWELNNRSATAGSVAFSDITTAANSTAAMTVDTGASLTFANSGTVNASQYKGSGTPTAAEFGHLAGVTSALQTQLNAKQGTLTNSAGLAAALSDETGTSLAVFNTNPILVTPEIEQFTVAGLPAAGTLGRIAVVTDGDGFSCTVGSGATRVLCVDDGAAWAPLGDGQAAANVGGANTEVQFNDGGSFGGDPGLAFNKTTNVLTATGGYAAPLGTITTDVKVLSASATLNDAGVAFKPIQADFTNTASASGSRLVEINVGGSPVFDLTTGGVAGASGGFRGSGTTADAGVFRTANNTNGLCARNAANSGNICLKLDGNDDWDFGAAPLVNIESLTTVGSTPFVEWPNYTSPGVSAANSGRVAYESASQRLRLSVNGGAYSNIPTAASTDTFSNKTLDTGTAVSAAVAWGDGVKQTFNPDGTNAGLNVGSVAGDPSAPANGDLWYDSTANELTGRINGANVALGAGGSTGLPQVTSTSWQRMAIGTPIGTGTGLFPTLLGESATNAGANCTYTVSGDTFAPYQDCPTSAATTGLDFGGGGTGINWRTDRTANQQRNVKMVVRIRMADAGATMTNRRDWIGLTDQTAATMFAADDPAGNYAAFRFSTTTETTWKCVTKDNTTQNVVDSAVTVSAETQYALEIEFNDATPSVTFRINGSSVCSSPITTNLPADGTNLRWIIGGETKANETKSIRVQGLMILSTEPN